jgi:methionine sulfoxide reductase heme-binding subunit
VDKSLAAVKLMVPLTAVVAIAILTQLGADNHGIREALRATARTSLVLFVLAYIASPLHRIRPSAFSLWLLRNRATIGVSFGLCLSSHIFLIIWLFVRQAPTIPTGVGPADFLIGIPGLIAVVFMVITSARKVRQAMSTLWWNRLHKYGIHLVWFIYTACLIDSFLAKSPPNPAWHYVPLIGLLIAAAAMRLSANMRSRALVKLKA